MGLLPAGIPILFTAVLLTSLVHAIVSSDVPHVSQCNSCKHCHVDKHQLAAATLRSSSRGIPAGSLQPSIFTPQNKQSLLPNCSVCHGCKTRLAFINGSTTFMNFTYANDIGAGAGWIFRVASSKPAVVKVYCIPLVKVRWRGVPKCDRQLIVKVVEMYRSIQQIADDCGLADIIPRVWIDKLEAVIPKLGFHIDWHGIWMEHAAGISVRNLADIGSVAQPQQVLDLLQNRLNGSQLIRAAVFDLLTAQRDRHAHNILIDEQGQLKMIDNEAALVAGFNSVLLPTSKWQARAILGAAYVDRQSDSSPAAQGIAPLELLLDYRCHLPDGHQTLDKRYPPGIAQCLTNISKMTLQQVQARYGLPEDPARTLLSRAKDLITMGFEWTLKNGWPTNKASKRFPLQPTCCSLKLVNGQYQCSHPWKPVLQLPQLPREDAQTRELRRAKRRSRYGWSKRSTRSL